MPDCWNIDSQWLEVFDGDSVLVDSVRGAGMERIPIPDGGVLVRVGGVDVRVVRCSGIARQWAEVWIGEVRIPPAALRITRGTIEPGTRCTHADGQRGEVYRRASNDEAIGTCGECREPVCAQCLAIDRVMCVRCFDVASRDYAQWDRQRRAIGWTLAAAASALATASALALEAYVFAMVGAVAVSGAAVSAVRAYRHVPTPPDKPSEERGSSG